MRTFWLMLMVVLGACGWLVWRQSGDHPATPRSAAPAASASAPIAPPPAQRSQPQPQPQQPEPAPVATTPEPPAAPEAPLAVAPEAVAPVTVVSDPMPPEAVPQETVQPAAPEASAQEVVKLPDLPTPDSPVVALEPWASLPDFEVIMAKGAAAPEPTASAVSAVSAASAEPEAARAPTPAAPAAPAAGASAGPRIVEREDGSRLVDGRFILRGEGTREKPYVITWDLVLSAEDEFAPKDGKTELPARIRMLDGKWVKVVGYVAFPLMVTEADELLVMMNEWDGCCLGIPPTPYDAIEVRLVSPVSGRDRLTNFGALVGRFKVEPHLIGGWLVGLYMMEQATLEPRGYGGFAP